MRTVSTFAQNAAAGGTIGFATLCVLGASVGLEVTLAVAISAVVGGLVSGALQRGRLSENVAIGVAEGAAAAILLFAVLAGVALVGVRPTSLALYALLAIVYFPFAAAFGIAGAVLGGTIAGDRRSAIGA